MTPSRDKVEIHVLQDFSDYNREQKDWRYVEGTIISISRINA